jgi:hypothetical protein
MRKAGIFISMVLFSLWLFAMPQASAFSEADYTYKRCLTLTNANATYDLEKGYTYNITFNSAGNITAGDRKSVV